MSLSPRGDRRAALVLLCSDLAPALDLERVRMLVSAPVEVVDGLCADPRAAAAALRATGADRAVVGLCRSDVPTADLLARARRAGAEPFGVQTISLAAAARAASTFAAARALAAAAARLDALPIGELGRAVVGNGPLSRGALLSLGGAISIEPVATLDRSACVGANRCGICAGVCPHRAIDRDADVVSVDVRLCDACGRCLTACPTGALHLAGAAPRQLEAQLDVALPAPGVAFRCRNAATTADELPAEWATIELPSLSVVTAGWILQALAGGAAAVRLLPCRGDCCGACAPRAAFCRTVLEQIGGRNVAQRVALGADDPPLLEPLDHVVGRVVLKEPRATVDALERLAAGGDATLDDPASPLGLLTLDATGCTLCGSCAVVCPTHALRLDAAGDDVVLRHDPRLCTGCGLCVATCPESVLDVRNGLDLARLEAGTIELARDKRAVCRGCGCELPREAMAQRVRELLASRWPELAPASEGLCPECARRTATR